jgi:hypothetical protein
MKLFRPFTVPALALLAASFAPQASALSLTTFFSHNNDGNLGGGFFFDMSIINPNPLTFYQIASNIGDDALALQNGTLDVYVTDLGDTYVGNESSFSAWTLVSSGSGISAGVDNPTIIDIADFTLSPGQYGIALVAGSTWDHAYTNGNGSNQSFSNSDLTLQFGSAMNVPFIATGDVFSPRVWNGTLYYTPVTAPVPGPLPALGMAVALGFSRKLKRRIKQNQLVTVTKKS